ncbi:hypothetical protein [Tabrizicola sp.]|uniref:hypothetical protein n=1 Tax=Tabrizicola sp. TaxID=2005166 RepID=UPI0035B3EB25
MDKTQSKPWLVPEYLTETEVATVLGRSRDWFRQNRPKLEREGFPRIDGLIGLTCRQDVLAWIKRRRRVADVTEAEARENAKGDASGSVAGVDWSKL